jgi:S1-C subfamily serine protease
MMRKTLPWLLILVLLLTSLACEISIPQQNLNTTTSASAPQVTPGEVEAISAPIPSVTPGTILIGDQGEMQDILVSLYETVSPGVVAIQTLTQQGGGLGSGFVYDKKGHIITNYHVVEGAEQLEVDFPGGLKLRGDIIATDLDSDLAVIKVDASAEDLYPLTLGDSDQLKVGQTVVAIGNPYGLSGTMTVGIISAKGRTLDSIRQSPEGNYYSAGDIIQTDASINPGNSGGPLLNLNGEVIGINRAIRTSGMDDSGGPINSGIGFAVSGNIIRRVVPYLIKNGKYDYPYLGITARPSITLIEQELLGLSQATGAYVTGVESGGPADIAGVKSGTTNSQIPGVYSGGDLIIAVDGRPVQVFADLMSYLMTNKSPGDELTLTIIRGNNRKLDLVIKLGMRR